MPYIKPLSALLLVLFVLSCKKDPVAPATNPSQPHDTTTTPTPPPPAPKLHMSLSYLVRKHTLDSNFRTNYELSVSEAGGKLLLDTLVDYNRTVTADLATAAKLLDVSVIYSDVPAGAPPEFMVYTYKSVDLAKWKNVPLSDSVPGQVYPVVTGAATMQLKNVVTPAPFYWQFMSNDDPGPTMLTGSGPWFSPEGISYSSDLTISYPWEQDDYAYIAFPYAALYKLHKIGSQHDTVDCSQLDTAKTISFNWAPQYDILPRLFGYMDTTNRNKALLLAPGHGQYTHNYTYETMVPANKKLFQKYDLLLTGYPTNYGSTVPVQAGIRWTWLDTIPVNVPFLDETYYTVNYKTPDSFSLSFPKVKPTFYLFSSSFNIGEFHLIASGDSTILDPEIVLARLVQGKLLKGGASPAMFINGFNMAVDDNPDYQSYMIQQGDVAAANRRPMSNQKTLAVGLGYQGGPAVTKFFKEHAMTKR
ncbi:MAG TPA: hypothetical protein VHE34_00140 [Puia sp.]|uniref:hypothetical protein n=1 Tax=Puia sp. TaxID=2045100 RepID=UPI002C32D1C0|nr:hypothetical protein [Puia sp.]HVU93594.1 hypothetical protein [Puia sp.]